MKIRFKQLLSIICSLLVSAPAHAVFVSGTQHAVYEIGADNAWHQTRTIKVLGDVHDKNAQDEAQFNAFKNSCNAWDQEGKKTIVFIEAPTYYDGKLRNNDDLLSHLEHFAYHNKDTYKNITFKFIDERGRSVDIFMLLAHFFAERGLKNSNNFPEWNAALDEVVQKVQEYDDPDHIALAFEMKLYKLDPRFEMPVAQLKKDIVSYFERFSVYALQAHNESFRKLRDELALRYAKVIELLNTARENQKIASFLMERVAKWIKNTEGFNQFKKMYDLTELFDFESKNLADKFNGMVNRLVPCLYGVLFEPLYNGIAESGFWMQLMQNQTNYDRFVFICGNKHAEFLNNLFDMEPTPLVNCILKEEMVLGDLPKAFIQIPEDEQDAYVLPVQLVQHVLKN